MENNELKHYGTLGMKWGVRRYENKDGTLTEAGKKRYAKTGESGYHYHSHATKKYDKKSAKAAVKGDSVKAARYKKVADRSRAMDKKEEEYARDIKTGRTIATGLLLNPKMRKAAQQNLAIKSLTKGEDVNDKHARRMSRGKAYLQTIGGAMVGVPATFSSRWKKHNYIHEKGKYSPEAIQKAKDKELANYFKKEAKKLPKSERKDAFKIGVSTTAGSTNKESFGDRMIRKTLERGNKNAEAKGRKTIDVDTAMSNPAFRKRKKKA